MTTLDPGTVDLDAVRDKIDAYKALDDQIKILTETKASLRRDIEIALGDNEIGKLDGHTVVTWKRNAKTRRFDKKAFERAHPEIAEEFTELVEGNRVFKVVE